MSWVDLEIDLLTEFAVLHHMVDRSTDGNPRGEGLEALRVAYRHRHAQLGLCRSCPSHAVIGRKSCAKHLVANLARAHASNRRPGLAKSLPMEPK